MEPRQGGRFHIWHMLTREMPFCNLCASKDGTFERDENCAPKRQREWIYLRCLVGHA